MVPAPGSGWLQGVRRSAVVGWVLYDLANTIFSLNITSVYFSLWIVNDLGGTDGDYGIAFSISMAFVFITAPLLGALSDQARRRMPFMMVSTVVCVSFTWFLGVPRVAVALILFGFANYFYQSGLIFYDALLPVVSTDANRGRIGGLGVGIGYLGSLLGIAVGAIATSTMGDREAKPFIFKATALPLPPKPLFPVPSSPPPWPPLPSSSSAHAGAARRKTSPKGSSALIRP